MQEINLLQNKLKDRTESYDRKNSILAVVLGFITVVVLGIGGFFYLMNQQTLETTNEVMADNLSIQAKLDSNQGDLADAKSFQAQLKNIEMLSNNHVYWSEVFTEVQETALKQSQYLLLTGKTDGRMHLEGLTPTYSDLGKLILSLATNPHVKEAKLLAVSRSTDQRAGFNFSIDVIINPTILKKQ